jgi:hypothetical protein
MKFQKLISKFEIFFFLDVSVLVGPLLMIGRGFHGDIFVIKGMQKERKRCLRSTLTIRTVDSRKRSEYGTDVLAMENTEL